MKRFKNISLVYECDPSTLNRAALLAKDNRAKLTIVYPIPEVPPDVAWWTIGSKAVDMQQLVLRECQSRVKETARSIGKLGVRPATLILQGDASLQVIRDVLQQRRDLVIMTAEGKGGLKERLFGSLSTRLMRKCPVPLLIMRPGRRKRFHNILAAIDPEVTGSVRDSLNSTILELASSLSLREDARLHVVHAWSLYGESLVRSRGGLLIEDLNRVAREAGVKRRRLVEEFLARHRISADHLHLVKGEAAKIIPQLADKLGIDLLIMGTVCRTGIPGFIMGNTAESVLDGVNCSVLVVKPEGFVSPVAALLATQDLT